MHTLFLLIASPLRSLGRSVHAGLLIRYGKALNTFVLNLSKPALSQPKCPIHLPTKPLALGEIEESRRTNFKHNLAASIATTILPLSVCALALLPSVSLASIFKCVDRGKVIYSASPCGENAQVFSARNDQPQQQNGTLTLYMSANKTYSVSGSVNNYPVVFIVDTGASRTVISQRVAAASGIRNCTGGGYSNTANGIVRNCSVTVPNISFGMFRFNNLIVTILPNMNIDALLGMDVLSQMKVQQQSGAMYISD